MAGGRTCIAERVLPSVASERRVLAAESVTIFTCSASSFARASSRLGFHPIVTSRHSAAAVYQFSDHIQSLFF